MATQTGSSLGWRRAMHASLSPSKLSLSVVVNQGTTGVSDQLQTALISPTGSVTSSNGSNCGSKTASPTTPLRRAARRRSNAVTLSPVDAEAFRATILSITPSPTSGSRPVPEAAAASAEEPKSPKSSVIESAAIPPTSLSASPVSSSGSPSPSPTSSNSSTLSSALSPNPVSYYYRKMPVSPRPNSSSSSSSSSTSSSAAISISVLTAPKTSRTATTTASLDRYVDPNKPHRLTLRHANSLETVAEDDSQ